MADERTAVEPAGWHHDSNRLGMYLFLASEVMLFGGLVAVLVAYRIVHPEHMAAASQRLDLLLGTVNTAVLLTSSACVAAAAAMAHDGRHRATLWWLIAATVLGLAFLAIKGVEYAKEYAEGLMPGVGPEAHGLAPQELLFFHIYFAGTGLHALHLTVGAALLGGLATRHLLGRPPTAEAVEICGLYWHLVDVIWVVLFPALYLVRT